MAYAREYLAAPMGGGRQEESSRRAGLTPADSRIGQTGMLYRIEDPGLERIEVIGGIAVKLVYSVYPGSTGDARRVLNGCVIANQAAVRGMEQLRPLMRAYPDIIDLALENLPDFVGFEADLLLAHADGKPFLNLMLGGDMQRFDERYLPHHVKSVWAEGNVRLPGEALGECGDVPQHLFASELFTFTGNALGEGMTRLMVARCPNFVGRRLPASLLTLSVNGECRFTGEGLVAMVGAHPTGRPRMVKMSNCESFDRKHLPAGVMFSGT